MTNTYCIAIPVKPYILKYVQTVEAAPALELKGSSMISLIIRAFIQNKNYTHYSQASLSGHVAARTARLQVVIPRQYEYTIGTVVNPHSIVLINRLFESWFEAELVRFVKENTRAQGRYKGYQKALCAFADAYNIDIPEDISLDGLKKIDYRQRTRSQGTEAVKNNSNYFLQVVPSVPTPQQYCV